jgi:DtxR family Mn-dependent transcriptional regulator
MLIELDGAGFRLTPAGRQAALRVIRAHRLWEQYLAQETGFEEADWHAQAEHYEHMLSAEEITTLARQLGHPTHDPHGDPIPDARGEFKPHAGQPLTSMPLDQPLRIVHLEDEPPEVYAQLVAEELAPGMIVRLTEVTPTRVHFWAYAGAAETGDEHVLAPVVAANISVVPLPEGETAAVAAGPAARSMPLSALKTGEVGRVAALSPRLRGAERRRMLDLGLLPGTEVRAELVSPSGDPTAYRVRETLIALRREQARLIQIEKLSEVN